MLVIAQHTRLVFGVLVLKPVTWREDALHEVIVCSCITSCGRCGQRIEGEFGEACKRSTHVGAA